MPVIEAVITMEKLLLLLAEQHESELLDYKRTLDLTARRDVCELVKDIGAMQINGGFIVIGADGHGELTGEVAPKHIEQRLFDQATIQAKVRKYLPEPFDVRSAVHEIDGKHVVLIYIGPSPDGFCIFRADGNYEGGTAFRAGDVFARHNTASEPWRQEDIARILRRLIEREKERWREEFREDMRRMELGLAASQAASGPATALTWRLDEAAFDATVIELFRRRDDIPIRLLLDQALADARQLIDREDGESELSDLLDRIVSLAALALDLDQPTDFDRSVDTLMAIYELGFGDYSVPRNIVAVPVARFWVMIVERAYALGALAVRREHWQAVRRLALVRGQSRGWEMEGYRSWLRHALTMGARTRVFSERRGDRNVELSLLSLANRHVQRLPRLRPDIPADEEAALDSLCQFDFLAALAVIEATGEADRSHFYTNFARFETRRVTPVVVRMIDDRDARNQVAPLDDEDLAVAIVAISQYASKEAFAWVGWTGFRDERISQFLSEYLPPETNE